MTSNVGEIAVGREKTVKAQNCAEKQAHWEGAVSNSETLQQIQQEKMDRSQVVQGLQPNLVVMRGH